MKNKKLLSIIGLAVAALGAGAFIYRDMYKASTSEGGATTEVISDTLDTSGAHTIAVGEPNPSGVKAPELVRSTDFKNTLTPEVKTIILTRLEGIVKDLQKDGTNFENWVVLGVYRKNLGDYEGARQAWNYSAALGPNEVVSYNNLADLYHYYLKDYSKSEQNWKKTIALNSGYIPGYGGLVDLYKYSLTEKNDQIPVVLKDGLAKNPGSVDLLVMLAHYYQDAGDTAQAKTAYNDAIAAAEKLGNANLVSSLKGELGALK